MARTLGLALGSGAARGWAHFGVLRGLDEIGVQPDVIAGASVGALIGGAHIVGALDAFEAWARELSPLSALSNFAVNVARGGLIDSRPAFDAFASFDRAIEALPVRFGAVATDLGDGAEAWLTSGSLLDAARASSAIPVLFQAVERDGRWLADGGLSNPVPVTLARHLGADIVIAVDLNDVPRALDRFNPAPAGLPALLTSSDVAAVEDEGAFAGRFGASIARFISETRERLEQELTFARTRQQATPQLFETAYAAVDIFQMHLGRARRKTEAPEICLTPDMRDALPNAFDRADDFIEQGRRALLARRADIERLLAG